VLQLRPYTAPYPEIALTSMESPAGMRLAGRFGAGVLSLAVAKGPRGPIDLADHWRIAEEAAAEAGTTVSRERWRLAVPMHLADTREEALDAAREGAAAYLIDYAQGVTGRPPPVPGPRERVIDQMVEAGSWVVGTPDDAIAAIRRLEERSGGFGCLLIWANEWASREARLRSYELFAERVAPHFTGALDGIMASRDIAAAKAAEIHRRRVEAVEEAQRDYERGGPA
jgi:limonene 1,2-monooxygenase